MFSKNTSNHIRAQVAGTPGVQEVNHHNLYLGLPTVVGKSRREVFGCFWDRVWNKFKGWKSKHLSKAGKEVLIKAVAQTVPSYTMSVFKLPDSLCNDIEAIIRGFW